MTKESIALITDMHIAPMEAGEERAQSTMDRPGRRHRHLDQALSQALASAPLLVLFGGDNTNQPVDRSGYCEALRPFLDRTHIPWQAIPGNHDVGSTVGWHHHDPERLQRCNKIFRDRIGPDRWICEAAGFRIIACNSQICGAAIPDAAEQDAWLAAALHEPTDLIKVVFFHTPAYLVTPDDDFDDGSEQMCLHPQARQPLLSILDKEPPDLVITAHAHRFWQRREPKWEWLGLPATALGQHEMLSVPSHHLPAGDDHVGWVSLARQGEGWTADFHRVG